VKYKELKDSGKPLELNQEELIKKEDELLEELNSLAL